MSRVSLSTLLNRSNNNMASGTHPVVRQTALEVIRRAYAEGINVQISEGHRSYARQNALYAQGRTTSGNIVTNARGGQSWHNFGIAIDFFLTNHSGNKAVWTVNSNWRRVAQIAKNLGFEWGGDWTSFRDYPHLQMTGGLTIAQMRAGRKPNLVSKVGNTVTPQTNTSTGGSIIEYMNANGLDSSYSNRAKLAKQHGISGYRGTATQNTQLLNKLKAQKQQVGWIKNNTGWWYQNTNGSYPKNDWQYINKKWYLFDKHGYILKGWQKVKDNWYYMDNSGAMQTGWQYINKVWYYLNASGAMQTGWIKPNASWYYLNPNGAMATGWKKVSGTWYYLNSSGRMQVGLIKVSGKDYYLQRDGALITDEVIKLEANKHGHLK